MLLHTPINFRRIGRDPVKPAVCKVPISSAAASTYEGDPDPTPIDLGLYRHGTGDNNWIATALATTAPALPVDYVFTGLATPGTDYTLTGGTLTGTAIQPGTNGTTVNLSAVVDDLVEGTEPAVFTLAGSGYRRDVNSQSKIVYLSDQAVPGAPGNLTAMLGDGKSKIRLTWTDLSSGETGFHIQRKLHDGDATTWATVQTTAANVTFWQDDLPGDYAGKVYDYRVFSFNAAGDSRAMPVASASGIALQDVTFTGQTILRDNNNGVYTGPQWHDANFDGTITGTPCVYSNGTVDGTTEWVYPISFPRSGSAWNSYLHAEPAFFYQGDVGNWRLKASTPGYTFPAEAVSLANGMLTATLTSSALPSRILDTQLNITWMLSTDGGQHYFTVGESSNRLYVTGGDANGAYETPLDIGCRAANGVDIRDGAFLEQDQRTVVDLIWAEFAGLGVYRVNDTRMSYSLEWTTDPDWGFADVAGGFGVGNKPGMLARTDGKGQCTAWADMLMITLSPQGIVSGCLRITLGDSAYNRFRLYSTSVQGAGTCPTSGFDNHMVVAVGVYSERIYDPTFGICTIKTDWRPVELQYEDENVAVLETIPPNPEWVPNPPSNLCDLDTEHRNLSFDFRIDCGMR